MASELNLGELRTPAHPIKEGENGNRAAAEQARGDAQGQREIPLVESVDDADGLEHTKSSEGDQRDAFICLLPPHGDRLRNKQQRIAEQTKSEDHGNNFFHQTPFLIEERHDQPDPASPNGD